MKNDRKNIILQSLASLLEERNLSKVTTALLAEKSEITEAALYRHFPSKRAIDNRSCHGGFNCQPPGRSPGAA